MLDWLLTSLAGFNRLKRWKLIVVRKKLTGASIIRIAKNRGHIMGFAILSNGKTA